MYLMHTLETLTMNKGDSIANHLATVADLKEHLLNIDEIVYNRKAVT